MCPSERRQQAPWRNGAAGSGGGDLERGGLGIHPETPLGRRYRDLLGRVNQIWTAAADTSLLLVAGRAIPCRTRGDISTSSGFTVVSALHDLLRDLPPADADARRASTSARRTSCGPSGALAWLDEIAAWVAAWQRTANRRVSNGPTGLIFAADHGIAAATKVSAYPTGVTRAMLSAFEEGRSTISAFARLAGATVTAVDVGVGEPTNDIRYDAAMSPERFDEIVDIAVDAVDRLDCDLLVLGEMGIGNTTASAAIAASLAGGETAAWVGRGTGVDDEGLARKRRAVQESVRRIAGVTDPLEILREVGGSEIVAITAATVAARRRSIPVVLDGYVVTAAVLPLHEIDRRRSITARSATARPSPATASSSSVSAKRHCSISTCASARGRGRWRRSR
jgi:nicotinate-nucleotide--dimethylbenzimidazole phosphoribosyltransferase